MLIKYSEIIEKYKLNFSTVLHVGAHEAEELDAYFTNGCKKAIWVEGNAALAENLASRLDKEKNLVLQAVVSDKDDQEVDFMIASNDQASSILSMGLHTKLFPGIKMESTQKVKTKTLKTLFAENNLSLKDIDFVNLDIQGAELLALKGMGDDIQEVKAIYTEVNTDYVYENCALMSEIDSYLKPYGFHRVETVFWPKHPWGDALYLKEGLFKRSFFQSIQSLFGMRVK